MSANGDYDWTAHVSVDGVPVRFGYDVPGGGAKALAAQKAYDDALSRVSANMKERDGERLQHLLALADPPSQTCGFWDLAPALHEQARRALESMDVSVADARVVLTPYVKRGSITYAAGFLVAHPKDIVTPELAPKERCTCPDAVCRAEEHRPDAPSPSLVAAVRENAMRASRGLYEQFAAQPDPIHDPGVCDSVLCDKQGTRHGGVHVNARIPRGEAWIIPPHPTFAADTLTQAIVSPETAAKVNAELAPIQAACHGVTIGCGDPACLLPEAHVTRPGYDFNGIDRSTENVRLPWAPLPTDASAWPAREAKPPRETGADFMRRVDIVEGAGRDLTGICVGTGYSYARPDADGNFTHSPDLDGPPRVLPAPQEIWSSPVALYRSRQCPCGRAACMCPRQS